MLKMIGLIVFCLLNYLHAEISSIVDDYQDDIASLIVKDVSHRKILYAKQSNQRLRPASLTKIMTALLAIESGKMNQVVTIRAEATKVVPSKADLKVGEKIYLRDLVKSTLISSANDSAIAIATHVGGSTRRFVAMMNRKARQLGMKNTRFTNPTGLDVGNHYSSAEDLLRLAEYAIKNKTFNSIVKLDQHVFSPINRPKKRYVARTSNRLLKDHKYAIGVKTGYTSRAGPCLIARVKKGNKDIVLVMLNSRSKRWESAIRILDGALEAESVKVAQKSEDKKPIESSEIIYRTPY